MSNTSLGKVLDEIENQSEFYFLFNQNLIDMSRKVSVSVKDKNIEQVLDAVLEGTAVRYVISDRQIILTVDNANDFFATSQQRKISGRVTESNGQPLIGVTVVLKNTTQGTITDLDGKFQLDVPVGAEYLVFSFIGMKTVEESIMNRTVVNITLEPDLIGLEEVVAIGYGTMKKSDLTGSVSSVKAEQLANEKPQSVQDLLRGNIAGLQVGFETNAKGGGSFEIRGDNTLKAGSSPLIVLDGVIYQGGVEDINPNDIETIDVLKDASSAAVYGARSANGVILITTKKGKKGKPVININSSFGLATMATMQDVYKPHEFLEWRTQVMKSLNMYSSNANVRDKLYKFENPEKLQDGVTEEMWRDGASGDLTDIWLARIGLLPVEIANYKAGNSVDWADMVFQNGLRQDHNISLSGQKEDITYYVSMGYNNNEGVIVGDGYQTIRSRINLDAKVTDWLSVGINTQFSNRDESKMNRRNSDGSNPDPTIQADWGKIINNSPWGAIYMDDGVTLRISPVDDLGRGAKHPLYDMQFQERRRIYNTLISTLYAQIKLPFNISYQMNFAPRFEWYEFMNHQSALHEEWGKFGGQAKRLQNKVYSWQIDNLIKWNRTFNSIHKFDVTLLINAEKLQSWENYMSAQDFLPTDALGFHRMQAGAGTSFQITSNDEYETGNALMGRLFYSLKDRYMLTLTMRRDGFSAFGENHPYGYFPSAALGWVFTDEGMFTNKFLTYGKLRLSWGSNGNRAIGRYDGLSDMTTGKYPYQTGSGTVYEGTQLYVNRMANPDLKWEQTESLNFGLDYSILDGIFDGSFEYYIAQTKDVLVDRALPDILGFSSVATNLGKVKNHGVEIVLNSRIIKRQNFSWNANVNFTLNRNEIVSLYGDMVDVLNIDGNVIGQKKADDYTNNWFIGKPIDVIWQPRIVGVWQVGEETQAARYGQFPGDFKLKDVNDDGVINNLDKEFLGYKEPRFRWNMRHEFSFLKHFNASFMLYSYWGHKGTMNSAKNRDSFPERVNSYKLPFWTPDTPHNNYARIYSAEGGAVFDVWRDRSFIRLDNISLAYNVPSSFLNRIQIQNLKVYGTIRNVSWWAPKWEFWDPENSGPNPRYFTLGVNLTL
ncbi:SusC/RagA family TonB-linked outer membrane protein [Gaoshiqia sp. Z1-71]|uniref:SusC/RagA family TonB-linked outer membrane protein n=1 Tax=Gaoshiqia hydrogeniformans TaxID=3290090 RepID=UPI003BF844F4